jgi:hypothetical protein
MPTENRRVAAYLPKELDDRFKSFIAERGLKGESPALIAILSEFLGVSQEVAHQSSSEFQALSLRVDGIDGSLRENSRLLGELLDRITKIESKSEPVPQSLVSVPVIDSVPGQLDLPISREVAIEPTQAPELSPSSLLSELDGSPPALSWDTIPSKFDGGQWLTTKQAHEKAIQRGCTLDSLSKFKTFGYEHPDKCLEEFSLRKLPRGRRGNAAPTYEDTTHAGGDHHEF